LKFKLYSQLGSSTVSYALYMKKYRYILMLLVPLEMAEGVLGSTSKPKQEQVDLGSNLSNLRSLPCIRYQGLLTNTTMPINISNNPIESLALF
jgi:hypothetical protein